MRSGRPRPPDEVFFPVVPMLDMAFQLLAFFILTFQAPSAETRIDLVLPAAPVVRPGATGPTPATAAPEAREGSLRIEARADGEGRLRSLTLDGTPLDDAEGLARRLGQIAADHPGRPRRVVIAAEEALTYQEAARLIGACSRAGVDSIRLAALAPSRPGPDPP